MTNFEKSGTLHDPISKWKKKIISKRYDLVADRWFCTVFMNFEMDVVLAVTMKSTWKCWLNNNQPSWSDDWMDHPLTLMTYRLMKQLESHTNQTGCYSQCLNSGLIFNPLNYSNIEIMLICSSHKSCLLFSESKIVFLFLKLCQFFISFCWTFQASSKTVFELLVLKSQKLTSTFTYHINKTSFCVSLILHIPWDGLC